MRKWEWNERPSACHRSWYHWHRSYSKEQTIKVRVQHRLQTDRLMIPPHAQYALQLCAALMAKVKHEYVWKHHSFHGSLTSGCVFSIRGHWEPAQALLCAGPPISSPFTVVLPPERLRSAGLRHSPVPQPKGQDTGGKPRSNAKLHELQCCPATFKSKGGKLLLIPVLLND